METTGKISSIIPQILSRKGLPRASCIICGGFVPNWNCELQFQNKLWSYVMDKSKHHHVSFGMLLLLLFVMVFFDSPPIQKLHPCHLGCQATWAARLSFDKDKQLKVAMNGLNMTDEAHGDWENLGFWCFFNFNWD